MSEILFLHYNKEISLVRLYAHNFFVYIKLLFIHFLILLHLNIPTRNEIIGINGRGAIESRLDIVLFCFFIVFVSISIALT